MPLIVTAVLEAIAIVARVVGVASVVATVLFAGGKTPVVAITSLVVVSYAKTKGVVPATDLIGAIIQPATAVVSSLAVAFIMIEFAACVVALEFPMLIGFKFN
jgi:hypothetical protein